MSTFGDGLRGNIWDSCLNCQIREPIQIQIQIQIREAIQIRETIQIRESDIERKVDAPSVRRAHRSFDF